MDRRQFFKTVAATAVVAVAAPAVVVARGGEKPSQRYWMQTRGHSEDPIFSRDWAKWSCNNGCGVAYGDTVNSIKAAQCHVGRRLFMTDGKVFKCVQIVDPIKRGQALVWNPDGTVRGV